MTVGSSQQYLSTQMRKAFEKPFKAYIEKLRKDIGRELTNDEWMAATMVFAIGGAAKMGAYVEPAVEVLKERLAR